MLQALQLVHGRALVGVLGVKSLKNFALIIFGGQIKSLRKKKLSRNSIWNAGLTPNYFYMLLKKLYKD